MKTIIGKVIGYNPIKEDDHEYYGIIEVDGGEETLTDILEDYIGKKVEITIKIVE